MKTDGCRMNGRSGFTLLEVVVAMAIVGLGVVTLLEVFSSGLRLGARSSVETESMAYGRQIMDEVLARRRFDEGATQGNFDGRGSWQLQIQTVEQPDSELSLGSEWELKQVSVRVRRLEAGREREVQLQTFRLVRKADG